jgi:hypothetical protein
MVQLAEALEKPGRPTFLDTPAWSLSILILAFVETEVCVPAGCPVGGVGKQSPYVLHGGTRQARPLAAETKVCA